MLKYDFETPTANGKKPDDTFIDKWIVTINELHAKDSEWIYEEIDWARADRFTELWVTGHQPKIRRSTRWADPYILDHDAVDRDSYAYVRWANYLLNNLASNLLDMDLWVLANVFVDRQIIGKPLNDLEDWIDYAPFRGEAHEQRYLEAIENGTAIKLNPYTYTGSGTIEDIRSGAVESLDENQYKFLGRSLLAQFIFSFADNSNYHETPFMPEAQDGSGGIKADFPIKTYLLPSMALHEYMKLGNKRTKDDPVRTFGDPAYIRIPIAKVVENNTIALKTTLKTVNTGDIVSIDSNLLIYFF